MIEDGTTLAAAFRYKPKRVDATDRTSLYPAAHNLHPDWLKHDPSANQNL